MRFFSTREDRLYISTIALSVIGFLLIACLIIIGVLWHMDKINYKKLRNQKTSTNKDYPNLQNKYNELENKYALLQQNRNDIREAYNKLNIVNVSLREKIAKLESEKNNTFPTSL